MVVLKSTHLFIALVTLAIFWTTIFIFQNLSGHSTQDENVSNLLLENKQLLQDTRQILRLLRDSENNRPISDQKVADLQNDAQEIDIVNDKAVSVTQRPQDDIKILLWEGVNWAHFGKNPKKLELPNYLGHEVDKQCDIPCEYMTDRSRVGEADAVIFEAATYGMDQIKTLPLNGKLRYPVKRPWQKWVNFAYETPIYFPMQNHSLWKPYMDIEMTYNEKPQWPGQMVVPITFTCSWGGGSIDDFLKPPPPKDPENAPILFIATNCGAGGATSRTEYVRELMRHIQVDSYGQCLHNKELPAKMKGRIYDDHGKSMRDKVELFAPYKFVLAFENNNITDYVTEKIVNVLQAGSVPIYMGAPNIDDWTPGDHSIVKTADFKGPQELAWYIKRVVDTPGEYAKFFEWKKKGLSERFKRKYRNCVFYGAECRLCKAINEQVRSKSPRTWEQMHALQMDGSGLVEIPHQANMNDVFKNIYTITAWIQANSINDWRILDKNEAGTINGFNFDVVESQDHAAGHLRLCAGLGCTQGSKRLYANVWYHVGVSFSIKTGKTTFFVDGTRDNEVDNGRKPTDTNARNLNIGSSNFSAGWDGMLDDVAVWDTELDEEDMRKIMYRVLNGDEDHLVAYWSFNEGRGVEVKDKAPKGSHWNGRIRGFANFVKAEVKPVHIRHTDVKLIVQ